MKKSVAVSKSKLKEFFKPDWKKIVLLIVIFIVISPVHQLLTLCGGFSCPQWGFPFAFLISGPCKITTPFTCLLFRLSDLVLDIIILYFFSCLILFCRNKEFWKKRDYFQKGGIIGMVFGFLLYLGSLRFFSSGFVIILLLFFGFLFGFIGFLIDVIKKKRDRK